MHCNVAGWPLTGSVRGIHAESSRVMADEAYGALRVLDGSGVMKPGRRAVIDREHRVATALQRLDPGDELRFLERRRAITLWGLPSAPSDVDDPMTIRPFGIVHVHQQGEP
jgi:hypothetical protein